MQIENRALLYPYDACRSEVLGLANQNPVPYRIGSFLNLRDPIWAPIYYDPYKNPPIEAPAHNESLAIDRSQALRSLSSA